MRLVVANWKANKNRSQVNQWWETFSQHQFDASDIQVIICPAFVHLNLLSELIDKTKLSFPVTVGVQDLSPFPGGAYTGEVTGMMLAGMVTHAIVGHSERRQWFGETPQRVAMKVREALENNIIPIVSVDKDNYRQQLTQFDDQSLAKIVVMYEPPEAISQPTGPIGRGKAAEISDVEGMVKKIQQIFPEQSIVYGGSVKGDNAANFFSISEACGVVVGSASLNANEFIRIIEQA